MNEPPRKRKKPNQCDMLKVDTDWLKMEKVHQK